VRSLDRIIAVMMDNALARLAREQRLAGEEAGRQAAE